MFGDSITVKDAKKSRIARMVCKGQEEPLDKCLTLSRDVSEEREEADSNLLSACSNCSHDMRIEEDEGEEDEEDQGPRPAKRRKRHSQLDHHVLQTSRSRPSTREFALAEYQK